MLVPPQALLSLPINNPFPVTLGPGTAAIAIFGAELVIAKLRVYPRRWPYVLLASCAALGLMLTAWSWYYTLYGPPAAEPRVFPTGARDPYYDFYLHVWVANIALFLVTSALVLATGIVLRRQKAKAT